MLQAFERLTSQLSAVTVVGGRRATIGACEQVGFRQGGRGGTVWGGANENNLESFRFLFSNVLCYLTILQVCIPLIFFKLKLNFLKN